MKSLYFFLGIITVFTTFAQSKKELLKELDYRIDSLVLANQKLQSDCQMLTGMLNKDIDDLKNQITQSENLNKSLTIQNQTNLNRIYDSLNFESHIWKFDTIRGEENHACYFMDYEYPHIIKSPFDENRRVQVNNLILNKSKEFPLLLSNVNYSRFRDCEPGRYIMEEDYNKEVGCCANQFYSGIEGIYIGDKYMSILFRFGYEVGGNWGHSGFNAINIDLKTGEEVKIIFNPDSWSEKHQFLENVNEVLSTGEYELSEAEDSEQCYSILVKDLSERKPDELTFYFKDDELHLVFMNSGHGPDSCRFDAKMVNLQNRMGY